MKTIQLKIDTYTKIILTIIAVALVANVFKAGSFGHAQQYGSETIDVNITDIDYGVLFPVNIEEIAGDNVSSCGYSNGGLPVCVQNTVEIEGEVGVYGTVKVSGTVETNVNNTVWVTGEVICY